MIFSESSIEIYRSIIEHNPDAIFILSTDGKILEINKVITRVLGYSQEEIQGVHYQEFIVPERSEEVHHYFIQALAGIPCEYETDALHKSGEIIHLQVKIIPLSVGGEISGVFCVAKDLTDSHKMKATLYRVEEKLKSLFNSIADAIVILDLEGNVVDINPAFEEIYGWKHDEIIGMPLPIISYDQTSQHNRMVEHSKLGQSIKGFETTYLKKDGTPIEVSLTVSPIRNIEGKIVAISEITRDVTEHVQLRESLKESEERYRKVVEYAPRSIIVHQEGTILYANSSALKMLKEECLEGKFISSYIDPDYREIYNQRVWKVEVGRKLPFLEIKMIRQDGVGIYVVMVGVSINYDGKPAILTSFCDVTNRNKAQQELEESEKRYRLLADNSLDLIQQVNLDGIITYASPSHKTVFGYEPEEYVGNWVFYQPEGGIDDNFKNTFLNMALTQTSFACEIVRRHKDGYNVWVELKGTPVFDEHGDFKHMMLVGRDITERKKYQKHLERLSYHDSLTSLPNRRLLKERLEQALKEAKRYHRRLAVMYMDIDKFKQINDTFGHDVGDQLLKQFSDRVKFCIRESDTFARQGGDEFTILLPEIQTEQDALQVAQQIFASLLEPWQIGEHVFFTTSSIGISFYPADGTTRHELMKHADDALYMAKESGRNNVKTYSLLKEDNKIPTNQDKNAKKARSQKKVLLQVRGRES